MTNNNAVAVTEPVPTGIKNLTEIHKASILNLLPKHVSFEKFQRVILGEFKKNPKLAKCTIDSMVLAISNAAALGILPNSIVGHGYLLPYWNSKTSKDECQFQIGYRGMILLARNSGEVVDIQVQAVHEQDNFHCDFGANEFRHIPKWQGDRGAPYLYWARAIFKDGTSHLEVMTIEEINKRRDNSQGYKSGGKTSPWHQWPDEMAKKTIIRNMFKWLPMDVEKTELAIKNLDGEGAVFDVDFSVQNNQPIQDDAAAKITDQTPKEDGNTDAPPVVDPLAALDAA